MAALHAFRRGFSVIPQDPVLFTGSVAFNLDPAQSGVSRAAMAEALRMSGFARTLTHTATADSNNNSSSSSSSGDVSVNTLATAASLLDMQVEGGGGSLSRGQCQLLCLARVILTLDCDRRQRDNPHCNHKNDDGGGDGDDDGGCGGGDGDSDAEHIHHNVVLVDEATAALDTHAESLILTALSEAVRKSGATLLAVTHDPSSIVPHICDHVLTMKDGVAVSLEKVTTAVHL